MPSGPDPAEAARETRRLDVNARYAGLPTAVLIENAGRGAADFIAARFGDAKRIAVVCGLGNNGGDGFVVARHLADRASVTVFLLGSPKSITTAEARANWDVLERTGVETVRVEDSSELVGVDFGRFDVVVDAMLGTGTRGEPREPCRTAIARTNAGAGRRVSIDVPSGHGTPVAAKADLTLSFQVAKTPDAIVLPLGVPRGLESRIGPGDVQVLARRRPDAHKGEAGRVLVVGGSAFFRGALEYAGRAAATIADLAYHCAPRPCEGAISRLPDLLGVCLDGDSLGVRHLDEILGRAEAYRVDSVVIGPGLGLGPGLGVSDETRELVLKLIPALASRKVVVDADGLNAIAGHLEVLGPHVALTPHRGEFRKLAAVGPSPDRVAAFAREHRCVLLVKGPVDIVSDGERTRLNYTGNPGMATGGTGDVLSGALAGFAATNSLFDAACAAAFVTGLAGDLAKETDGEHFTAGDVLLKLAAAIHWAEHF
jgi:ADP-dependent NAD(P)H-hydrate dehydratase / NAD(P)H-hydrate epimerase